MELKLYDRFMLQVGLGFRVWGSGIEFRLSTLCLESGASGFGGNCSGQTPRRRFCA